MPNNLFRAGIQRTPNLRCRRATANNQQYSGSLQSEGDRYSYVASASNESEQDSGSQDGMDPNNEPLLDCPRYHKIQDLNRWAAAAFRNGGQPCLASGTSGASASGAAA